MSGYMLEQVLYDLGTRRDAREAFASDAAGLLARYRLEPAEIRMVAEFDVAQLQREGVSPLLTYGYWMMNAPSRTRASYLARLRETRGEGAWHAS